MSTEPFEIHTPGNPPASMPEGGWPEVPKPFANSGDFRNSTLDEHFDKALESVRKMCLEYAAHQTKHLTDECAALRAERDALKDWLFGCKKERDALKAQMETVAKGSFDATAVMAEENRLLRAELGQARDECAKLRGALKKITQELSNNHQSHYTALDALAATQYPPILDATTKT